MLTLAHEPCCLLARKKTVAIMAINTISVKAVKKKLMAISQPFRLVATSEITFMLRNSSHTDAVATRNTQKKHDTKITTKKVSLAANHKYPRCLLENRRSSSFHTIP